MLLTRDNTLQNARNLGNLSGPRTLQDSVTNRDRTDYIKFQLGSRSRLTLSLNQLQRSANLQLLSQAGTILAQFNQPAAGRGRAIAKTLNAGLYYVRVGRISGDTRYTLQLNTPPLRDPGNIPVHARNLGSFSSGNFTFRETVGSLDHEDYYRFQLSSTTNVGVILNGTGNVNISLYRDINNNRAIDNNESVTGMFGRYSSFSYMLPAGSYYLKASNYGASSRYTLTLNSTAYPDYTLNPDPGSQASTARDLGSLPVTVRAQDYVSNLDGADYYRFQVGSVTNLNVITNSLDGGPTTTLYKDLNNNTVIDDAERAYSQSGNSTSFSTLLTPGTYYISVEDYLWDATRYSLVLNSTAYSGYAANPDPGNQAYMAQNLGSLGASTFLREYVGNFDTVDYYRFQIDSISNFSAIFTGLEGSIQTTLYRDWNNNSVIDSGEWVKSGSGTSGSFSEWLTPGTYYIGVERSIYNSTRYDLTLNNTAYPSYTSNPDPGSQAHTARNLGTPSQTITLLDYVGKFDEVDYYQFQVNDNRTFSATLTGFDGDTTIALYQDLNGNSVIDSGEWLSSRSGAGVSLTRALTPGIYYVSVAGSPYDSTRYQLEIAV